MKQLIALGVIAAVASGLIATWAVNQATERAGAAPPPPQAREDQITIYAAASDPTRIYTCTQGCFLISAPRIELNSNDYPANAAFRFEAVNWLGGNAGCAQLFDLTAGTPVAGSEVCGFESQRVRSGPISIAAADHEYTIFVSNPSAEGTPWGARIIVEWTERSR